ncbi:MAG: polysaccharide biosynthesis tyrosine autokinase [Gaiellaceae bacterium]
MRDEPDLRHYVTIIRRHIWLVVATTIIVGGVAFGASRLQTPRYRATSTVLFTPMQTSVGTTEDPARVLSTLAKIATTNPILSAAATKLGTSADALSKDISVSASPDQDLLLLTATGISANGAARKANVVTDAFLTWNTDKQAVQLRAQIAVLQRQLRVLTAQGSAADLNLVATLQGQLSQAQTELKSSASDLSSVQAATAPKQPYTPHPVRNMVIGLLSGLLLGILGAFLRERMGQRLRAVEEVEHIFGRPSLGIVPYIGAAARGNRRAAVGNYSGSSTLEESYRTIRTNLELFRINEGSLKTVVITSSVPTEGKSAVTANLAAALASSGRNVLAVSADLRSPALHKYFAGREGAGVVEILSGEMSLTDAARQINLDGGMPSKVGGKLSLLGNSRSFFDPVVLFQSIAMAALLKEACAQFDIVLFDAPPILASADAYVLAQKSDALLLVARLDRVTSDQARRAARTLRTAEVTPLGLIVTGIRSRDEAYGYDYGTAAETS